MDMIDRQIVKCLQKNGRISIKKLSEIVCLTPPAVAERIRKLEEADVIMGYRAVINPQKIGMNIEALINITLKAGKRKEFIDFVRKSKCIVKCYHVTGGFSMTVKVIVKETSELETLVGKIQQYGNTQTLIILSTIIEYKGIV
ncbi:Lrp/AsnC family transcriptional regulator [Clostridium ljungdahlii]|uniref:Leucine-responsive regulatory protein n=1 Tax=Clostridium ljungdahlii TaxID=1538 RepID=A0A168NRZ9_9CLOT|nr:Lrp/AsnC family transcriptional regulator [Clostridium ljungdahlii]OAA86827.1 Leucine-responsive regulatory protein [Clostridium ljungdahlii]